MPGATVMLPSRTSAAARRALLPNGVRLSCAAVVCFSQMQFYYDGRRQLQPLVRLRTEDRCLGATAQTCARGAPSVTRPSTAPVKPHGTMLGPHHLRRAPRPARLGTAL